MITSKKIQESDCATTKQVNVSDLTENQKQAIFVEYINRSGFIGFIKRTIDDQTYYFFTYEITGLTDS